MSRDHFNLDGRIALVAGASRGIGEAIARRLADYGAHVLVTSRRIDGCQAVADAIRAAGGKADPYACHLGDLSQIERLYQEIDARYGRLDILVNNAAANPYYGHILDTPVAAFEKTVEVNLRGFFYMSVEAAKRMRAQGGGSIVNVSSANAITASLETIASNGIMPIRVNRQPSRRQSATILSKSLSRASPVAVAPLVSETDSAATSRPSSPRPRSSALTLASSVATWETSTER